MISFVSESLTVRESPREDSSERSTLGRILYRENSRTPVSEAEWVRLVERLAAGDQGALHALYEKTHRIVFTLMVRIVGNRETAEELTVDVFFDLWRRASSYDPADGTVLGWMMNQARSRAIDRLRFEGRRKRVPDGSTEPPPTAAPDDPQQICQLAEQSRLLRKALDGLTPAERQVLESAYFSESTYREVALQLNQPIGTVKTRIRSALAKLRVALELKGVGL
jgi:RNA polymerase sigma-70 factor (ECF subfamily)